jgi:hypothetical protein
MSSPNITFERKLFAGVDVGLVNDWSTIAIIERVTARPQIEGLHHALHAQAREDAAAIPVRLDLRHLERIPLGTLYPEQVAMVQRILTDPRVEDVDTYMDMTGCGRPVYDMFKAARLPNLHGITITGSQGEAKRMPYGFNVGKAELVNRVQVEMQTGRLRLGRRVQHVEKLVRELKEFRAKPTAAGHMTFNAREGQNDDLVLATSYAVFGALRPRPMSNLDMRIAS